MTIHEKECVHPRIELWTGVWVCENCGEEFVKKKTMLSEIANMSQLTEQRLAAADNQNAAIIEAISTSFAAILWEHQQHAFEAFGVKPTLQSPEELDDAYPANHDCAADGHLFHENNCCEHCGAYRFLGGTP